jgi:peptide/nickel transport system substrate-binding protein
VTQSQSTGNGQRPRREAPVPALAAGLLVIVVAFIAVFWSEMGDAFNLGIADSDDEAAVDVIDDDVDESPTPAPEGASDAPYVEADVGFPTTLNPLLASSSSEKAATSLLYRTLLTTDESGDPAPALAEDWTVSSDGLTYALELDPDAEWHDGEPVSADDVLFTVSLVQDAEFPGDRELARFWRAISAQRTGDRSLEFTLLEPYAGFLHYLRLPVLPKHQFGDALPGDLADRGLDEEITGSGPFQLEEVSLQDGELRFTRADDTEETGFSEIVIRYFESRDDAVEAFGDGDVDGLSYVPLDVLHDDQALPGNSQIYGPELAGYTALYFNVRHPHFREANTRRAIEAAVDREAIVETVMNGHAIEGDSPVPRMSSAYSPGNHLEHDRDEAEELLERDGWTLGDGDDVRQRDGEYFLIPLIVNSNDPLRVAVATLIQEQLREVGISVDVQVMEDSEVQEALASRQFTAAVFGWHTENGSLDAFQLWHSSQGEDGMNFTGFADSEADEYLMEARQAAAIEDRNAYYVSFQDIFAQQVPAVVLFYPRHHFALSERVQGAEPIPMVTPSDRVRQIPGWYQLESSGAVGSVD